MRSILLEILFTLWAAAACGAVPYCEFDAPDLSAKNEVVITNAIGAWPKLSQRVLIEIENLDETCGEVLFVGACGKIAAGKDRGKEGTAAVLSPFDLPDCGRRKIVISRQRVVGNLDTTDIRIRLALEKGVRRRFGVRRILLLDGKEALPQVEESPCRNRNEEREHAAALERFRSACGANGLAVGVVSSMEAVRPRANFAARPAANVALRLAQNENESVQVVVTSMTGDLKCAGVEFAPLRSADGGVFDPKNLKCSPVGYVEAKHPKTYVVRPTKRRPARGWWPDAILDFTNRADIAEGDAQSFWIRVKCPKEQNPGVYGGEMKVVARQKDLLLSRTIPLTIRVDGFALPDASMLPLAITFGPNERLNRACCRTGSNCIHRAWLNNKAKYADFLADYYITWMTLYADWWKPPHQPHYEELKRLKEQGRLGFFNVYYFSEGFAKNEKSWNHALPSFRRGYERAKELGLADRAFFYGCDESNPNEFKHIAKTVDLMHQEFPGVKLMTTARDWKLGVDGSVLTNMDIFCPATCFWNPSQVKKSRAAGHQVWWYFCNDPSYPYADAFVETPPIELRSFMGAQTVKYRPDGFLYYETSVWRADRPIMEPFCDWEASNIYGRWYLGDGQWTCCGGPDMLPLPTLRLENFRDGLEDYAYAKILEAKLAACRDTGCAWAVKARAALAVPSTLVKSLSDFSIDPAVLYAWRNSLADLIESAP